MKYYPLTGSVVDDGLLRTELANGRTIGKVTLGDRCLLFKEKRKLYYIAYEEIQCCFRRVLLIPTRMCCGRGNLEVENLVICGQDGELAQIQLPGERAGKILLEEIAQKAPHVQIGRPKEKNNEN